MESKSQVRKVLRFCRKSEKAILPKIATQGSAGMDLHACIDEEIVLKPGNRVLVPCGFAISIPGSEYAAFIFARSGLAVKHGITLSNGVGVVDSDYRGEICVGLYNSGEEEYHIKPQERIAQMVIMPVESFPMVEVESLDDTSRGENGFGSTGK
ncbi:MAG: dUTP diphosphatase [Acutalibacteraceae bacterium]